MAKTVGKKIHINGIVQGVGFRPFVFSTAIEYGITGWVRNSSAGVDIVANGSQANIDLFVQKLKNHPPPLSKIDVFEIENIHSDGFVDFKIIPSKSSKGDFALISPDVSICEECRSELFDPKDRRFRYPFINCTNCGPRFTIVKEIPYDRPYTTMAAFELCINCLEEYENPLDRRFHAQPVACPKCGPRIWLETPNGEKVFYEEGILLTRKLIKDGKIIAVKGLGGFHLVCDALNFKAIEVLRNRKKRSDKAFAVMVFDASIANKYCKINKDELNVLESKEKPILLLEKKSGVNLPANIAPNMHKLGMMLPYTPLHLLLLQPEPNFPEILIMTSGNTSDEPIAYTNLGAKAQLNEIADAYLLNDRDIYMHVDDSVVSIFNNKPYFFRRARGYAPNPIRLKSKTEEILAVGAELKNTFCLTKENYAFVSHHIGNIKNLETLKSFEQGISHYQKLFHIKPKLIAHDLHPDYLTTNFALDKSISDSIPTVAIQHHHAHLASCLADNNWTSKEKVLGICFDGTGYGTDGKIWGGEFLLGNYQEYKRVAHLAYMPLPGGDAAILQPRKTAAAYLWKNGIDLSPDLPTIQAFNQEELEVLTTQLEKEINTPYTSSMGRLFDAVASIIGVRQVINYEAQAAINLESIANPDVYDCYDFNWDGNLIFVGKILSDIIQDFLENTPVSTISARFHNTIAQLVADLSLEFSRKYGFQTIALSGGVWQNMYLLKRTFEKLRTSSLQILTHRQMPANDGGISLGQAFIANLLDK
jgi:hydrogenase maturation protein HypF